MMHEEEEVQHDPMMNCAEPHDQYSREYDNHQQTAYNCQPHSERNISPFQCPTEKSCTRPINNSSSPKPQTNIPSPVNQLKPIYPLTPFDSKTKDPTIDNTGRKLKNNINSSVTTHSNSYQHTRHNMCPIDTQINNYHHTGNTNSTFSPGQNNHPRSKNNYCHSPLNQRLPSNHTSPTTPYSALSIHCSPPTNNDFPPLSTVYPQHNLSDKRWVNNGPRIVNLSEGILIDPTNKAPPLHYQPLPFTEPGVGQANAERPTARMKLNRNHMNIETAHNQVPPISFPPPSLLSIQNTNIPKQIYSYKQERYNLGSSSISEVTRHEKAVINSNNSIINCNNLNINENQKIIHEMCPKINENTKRMFENNSRIQDITRMKIIDNTSMENNQKGKDSDIRIKENNSQHSDSQMKNDNQSNNQNIKKKSEVNNFKPKKFKEYGKRKNDFSRKREREMRPQNNGHFGQYQGYHNNSNNFMYPHPYSHNPFHHRDHLYPNQNNFFRPQRNSSFEYTNHLSTLATFPNSDYYPNRFDSNVQ